MIGGKGSPNLRYIASNVPPKINTRLKSKKRGAEEQQKKLLLFIKCGTGIYDCLSVSLYSINVKTAKPYPVL